MAKNLRFCIKIRYGIQQIAVKKDTKKAVSGGRQGVIKDTKSKLLFILMYAKSIQPMIYLEIIWSGSQLLYKWCIKNICQP